MKHLILILPIFCAGCLGRTEYVAAPVEIETETLTPCAISDRQAETYRDLAVLATEHLQSARCANGKIVAIAEIIGAR